MPEFWVIAWFAQERLVALRSLSSAADRASSCAGLDIAEEEK
jgi:hypothetical protein